VEGLGIRARLGSISTCKAKMKMVTAAIVPPPRPLDSPNANADATVREACKARSRAWGTFPRSRRGGTCAGSGGLPRRCGAVGIHLALGTCSHCSHKRTCGVKWLKKTVTKERGQCPKGRRSTLILTNVTPLYLLRDPDIHTIFTECQSMPRFHLKTRTNRPEQQPAIQTELHIRHPRRPQSRYAG
jgi:hypothetical protein